ncbi:MAG: heme biosynthesis protein HemY [Hyphomicrobiales bacterium]|nr:heme biosynthesis protein HemY [Hyphomicrobiales bacterium]
MIRLLVFLLALVGLAFGFSWLADHPGEASITWLGQRVETDTTTLGIALAVGFVALIIVLVVLRAIWNAPGSLGSFFGRRRRERGWRALSRGMIAVGAGDLGVAVKAAADARSDLGDEPLALLLEAQQAQLLGDRGTAGRAFEAMLEKPETRLLGLRGLYVEAVRWGDGPGAEKYAEAAHRAAPRLAWAGQALVEYRTRGRDWQGALETIDQNRRHGIVDKVAAKRLRAVVLTADGLERETSHPDIVRGTALEAVGLAPDLVPAATLAARVLARAGDMRKATKILETAWKAGPHPELAEAYARLRPGDGARDRLARIRKLVEARPNHAEGALALARALVDAHDFAAAREALKPLVAEGPTRRVCLLMSEIEDGEGGTPGAVRGWLTRAVHAPRDPAWVADGFVTDRWSAVSPISGRLDAFEWKVPPEDVAQLGWEDPADEADETQALSGAIVPIETVRREATPASAPAPTPVAAEEPIPAPAAPAAPVEPAKIVEAAPIEVPTAEPATASVEAKPTETNGASAPAPASAEIVDLAAHMPDDPGPVEAEPVKPKRFRLFS